MMLLQQIVAILNTIPTPPAPTPEATATLVMLATQAVDTVKTVSSSTADAISTGAFVTGLLAAILGFIRIVLPAIGKRFAKSQEVKAQQQVQSLESEKADDKFTIEARNFMAEIARDNLTYVKTSAQQTAEENKKLLIEIGNLQARDQINRAEIERLQRELSANQQSTLAAQTLLRDTQNEILKLQTQLITLQLELDKQTKRNDDIASQLITLKKKTSEITPVTTPIVVATPIIPTVSTVPAVTVVPPVVEPVVNTPVTPAIVTTTTTTTTESLPKLAEDAKSNLEIKP